MFPSGCSCTACRRVGRLSPHAQYLLRLRLAAGTDEVLANQVAVLRSRLAELREQVHFRLRTRTRVSPARASRLSSWRLAGLLRLDCCRRTIRRTVSLTEALGPVALLSRDTDGVLANTHWKVGPW